MLNSDIISELYGVNVFVGTVLYTSNVVFWPSNIVHYHNGINKRKGDYFQVDVLSKFLHKYTLNRKEGCETMSMGYFTHFDNNPSRRTSIINSSYRSIGSYHHILNNGIVRRVTFEEIIV